MKELLFLFKTMPIAIKNKKETAMYIKVHKEGTVIMLIFWLKTEEILGIIIAEPKK